MPLLGGYETPTGPPPSLGVLGQTAPYGPYAFGGSSAFYHPVYNLGAAQQNGFTSMQPFSDPNWRPTGGAMAQGLAGLVSGFSSMFGGAGGGRSNVLPPYLTHPPDPQWALTRHQINQSLALANAQASGDRQRVLAAQALGMKQLKQNQVTDLGRNLDTLANNNLTSGFTQHYQQGKIVEGYNQQRQSLSKQTADSLASIANTAANARLSAQQGLEQGALNHQGYQQNNSYYINPAMLRGQGGHVVAAAAHQLGVPYVWGGESHSGFDCSGLLYWSLNRSGIHVPRMTAQGYYNSSQPIGKAQLRPGDAVFFHYNERGEYVNHVGIYVGNGKMIVAPHPGSNVQIQSVDWSAFLRGGRF